MSPAGIIAPASAIPLVIIDPETASIIHAPVTRTWPRMHPADQPRSWEQGQGQPQGRTFPHQQIREIYQVADDDLPWLDGSPPGADWKTRSGTGPNIDPKSMLVESEKKVEAAKEAVEEAAKDLKKATPNQRPSRQRKFDRTQLDLGVALGEVKAWETIAADLINEGDD